MNQIKVADLAFELDWRTAWHRRAIRYLTDVVECDENGCNDWKRNGMMERLEHSGTTPGVELLSLVTREYLKHMEKLTAEIREAVDDNDTPPPTKEKP